MHFSIFKFTSTQIHIQVHPPPHTHTSNATHITTPWCQVERLDEFSYYATLFDLVHKLFWHNLDVCSFHLLHTFAKLVHFLYNSQSTKINIKLEGGKFSERHQKEKKLLGYCIVCKPLICICLLTPIAHSKTGECSIPFTQLWLHPESLTPWHWAIVSKNVA